jgi:hypothetical protein
MPAQVLVLEQVLVSVSEQALVLTHLVSHLLGCDFFEKKLVARTMQKRTTTSTTTTNFQILNTMRSFNAIPMQGFHILNCAKRPVGC